MFALKMSNMEAFMESGAPAISPYNQIFHKVLNKMTIITGIIVIILFTIIFEVNKILSLRNMNKVNTSVFYDFSRICNITSMEIPTWLVK